MTQLDLTELSDLLDANEQALYFYNMIENLLAVADSHADKIKPFSLAYDIITEQGFCEELEHNPIDCIDLMYQHIKRVKLATLKDNKKIKAEIRNQIGY